LNNLFFFFFMINNFWHSRSLTYFNTPVLNKSLKNKLINKNIKMHWL